MDDINDYLNEYRSIGVGPMIYDLIYKIVAGVVQHYPPSVYSPNDVWDEDAVSGICHDFVINKLLSKGWLDYYFLSLTSLAGLKNVLKRDFRHYLISKKIRTEKSNLHMRVRKILKDAPEKFQSSLRSDGNGNLWGLAGWTEKEVAQDIQVVMAAMSIVQIPHPIMYRSDSDKI
jgi:hypothetical protein